VTRAVATARAGTGAEAAGWRGVFASTIGAVEAHSAVAVIFVASAWAILETWPVITQFGTTIYGTPGDATGTVGLYWWWEYAARHGLSVFDNTMQGVPLGSGWDTIPFNVLPIAILTPLALLFGPIAAYNVEILSSFPLTAWPTYLLGRQLGLTRLAAAFSGLAFATIPFHIQKAMGHAGQTHMEFFPATLLFLVRWRQGGSRWNLAAAGAVAGLQLWMDFYFTAILVLLVAVAFVASAVLRDPRWRTTRSQLQAHLAAGGIILLVASAFLPLAIVFAHRPSTAGYLATAQQAAAPVIRSEGEVALYSARLQFYFMPLHDNPLVPAALNNWEIAHLHGNNFVEASLFMGYTVMALALAGLLTQRWRFPSVVLAAIGLAGFLFSLPPDWSLPVVRIHAPSHYLYLLVPLIRVYSRFGVLAVFAGTGLAGFGYAVLQNRARNALRPLVLAVPFVLVALEFNNVPPAHTTPILPAPAEYAWLKSQPPGTLIEYPIDGPDANRQEIATRQYALYQSVHEHAMFNTGQTNGPAADRAPQLEPYYGIGVVNQLSALHIQYVFVHRDAYATDGWSLPQHVDGLQYVTTLGDTDIYLVTGG
jgi:hypothetical protein